MAAAQGKPVYSTSYPTGSPGYPNPNANVTIIMPPPVVTSKNPVNVTCPNCGQIVTSSVKYESSSKTHLWALCLCCLAGIICCWVPYCTKSCRTAVHTCPQCKYALGSFRA